MPNVVSQVVYYFVAHHDDLALFRGHQAVLDIQLDFRPKVVMVTLTAGDGGLGDVDVARQSELAGINMSRAAVDGSFSVDSSEIKTVEVNGHRMGSFAYENTVNYCLRIRDGGNRDGGRFLERLEFNQEPAPVVGDATPYETWDDLVATLREVIARERNGEPTPWMNSMDPDSTPVGPTADNPDHIQVGRAVRDALASVPPANPGPYPAVVYFQGYPIWNADPKPGEDPGEPPNLDAAQVKAKQLLFDAWKSSGPALQAGYDASPVIYDEWMKRSRPV